jgi:hypothetical protein
MTQTWANSTGTAKQHQTAQQLAKTSGATSDLTVQHVECQASIILHLSAHLIV